MSANGGTPGPATRMTTTGPNDADRYPQFLPDGEHFLYLHLVGDADVAGVYVAALDGSTPVRLLPGQDNALYLASPGARTGHLVFRRQDKLMAQAFDPVRRELSGAVFPARGRRRTRREHGSRRVLCVRSRQPGLRTRHDYTCGDGVVLIKAPKLSCRLRPAKSCEKRFTSLTGWSRHVPTCTCSRHGEFRWVTC